VIAWKATATVAVALPSSLVEATPALRVGEEVSSPLLTVALSLVLRLELLAGEDELLLLDFEAACGPMGITPVNIRFEAASASSVRPRVRLR
jgi:hypothetical protein